MTLSSREFAALLSQHAMEAQPDRRETADYLTAFGSEAVGSGPKKELMSDTEFRTMSGSGNQHFLRFMKDLAIGTGSEAPATVRFLTQWDYDDGRPSLSAGIPPTTAPMLSAPRTPLAIQSKPCEELIVSPSRRSRSSRRCPLEGNVGLLAFHGSDTAETEITWPIWT